MLAQSSLAVCRRILGIAVLLSWLTGLGLGRADAGDCLAMRPGTAFDHPRPLYLQFNLVIAVAERLRADGHDVGPTIGIYWDPLKVAVAAYQKRAGLEPTGYPDCETVRRLLGVDLRERLQ